MAYRSFALTSLKNCLFHVTFFSVTDMSPGNATPNFRALKTYQHCILRFNCCVMYHILSSQAYCPNRNEMRECGRWKSERTKLLTAKSTRKAHHELIMMTASNTRDRLLPLTNKLWSVNELGACFRISGEFQWMRFKASELFWSDRRYCRAFGSYLSSS